MYHNGTHNYAKLANGNLYFTDESNNNILIVYREGNGLQLTEGDFTIPATSKLRLDGATSGDTYIHQSSNDIMQLFTGGENMLELSSAGSDPRVSFFNKDNIDRDFSFCGDSNENVLYFDASTERVGIGTSSPGNKFTVNSTSAYQASIQYDASTRLRISVEGSGKARLYTVNSANFGIESGGLYVQPTQKFLLDGGLDTYIKESSANVMEFYCANSRRMQLTTTYLAVPDNAYLAAGNDNDIFIRHDGNGHLQSNAGTMFLNQV